MDKTPFSKTPFSENALGPNLGGAGPQNSRPQRPLENRKKGDSRIDLAGWGFYPPPNMHNDLDPRWPSIPEEGRRAEDPRKRKVTEDSRKEALKGP